MSRVSASMILPIASYLREVGADVAAIAERAGLAEANLDDPDFRLSTDTIEALVGAAIEATGDTALPIRAAERLQTGDFGVFEYLLRTSASGREIIDKVSRFHHLLGDGSLHLEVENGRATVWVDPLDAPLVCPQAAEYVLASWLAFGRLISGRTLVPIEVEFAHAEPADTTEQSRFFGCPLFFARESYRIVFPADQLDQQSSRADRQLATMIEFRAQQLLDAQRTRHGCFDAVRDLIRAAFRDGNPSAERVAAELHMSPRTLRRRLESEGTTFQQLRDDLRKEHALHYLADPALPIGEVAFLLGFAEPSAFHRAFKRWTGLTPAEHRSANG